MSSSVNTSTNRPTLAANMLSASMARSTYQPDFMVHEGACFITGEQLQLVFSLLDEKVDPISIPEYVARRTSGVDLTAEDVREIKNGDFHMSSGEFHVRMSTTGNFVHIDVINDYYLLVKSASSLESVKAQLENENGIVLSDHDILDMSYGSFHIAGPETMDLVTKDKTFVPSPFISEAAWMLDRQLPCDFVLRHLWHRFHVRLSFAELLHHAVMKYQGILEHAAVMNFLQTSVIRPVSKPPSLKQTARRALPPLPIIAFPGPITENSKAERVAGWTFTANPDVLCHNDDGAYSMYADFEGSDLDSEIDSEPADSIMADMHSRILVQLEEGDYLVDLENPSVECIRVQGQIDGAFSPIDEPITCSSGRNGYQSNLFSLSDLQMQDPSQSPAADTNSPGKETSSNPPTPDFADLPTLGKTILEGLGCENDEDLLRYVDSDDALSFSDLACDDLPTYAEIDDFANPTTPLPPTTTTTTTTLGLDWNVSTTDDLLSRTSTSSSYDSQSPSAQDLHTLLLQPEAIDLDLDLEKNGHQSHAADFDETKLSAAAAGAYPDLLFDVADPSLEDELDDDEEVGAMEEEEEEEEDRGQEEGGVVKKKSKRSSLGCDRQVQ